MDIITFSTQLREKLQNELEATRAGDTDSLQSAAQLMRITESILGELKVFVKTYSFSDIEEEILFFKEYKPVLASQYFYHKDLFAISLKNSFAGFEQRNTFYQYLLDRMDRFSNRHKGFLYYVMSGDRSLDYQYFSRRHKSRDLFLDTSFSTGYDNVLARILCHELLRQFLHNAIRKLDTANSFDSRLNWTGNKTDLIELLYALHASGSINNSEAEVKQIASALETVFHVKLGNYYDSLKKIAMRKKGQIPFLDSLREKLLVKLREMDG